MSDYDSMFDGFTQEQKERFAMAPGEDMTEGVLELIRSVLVLEAEVKAMRAELFADGNHNVS